VHRAKRDGGIQGPCIRLEAQASALISPADCSAIRAAVGGPDFAIAVFSDLGSECPQFRG